MLCAGNTYFGIVGPCGGHTSDYHFHRGFSCLYAESGGHSTKVGDVASHAIYGKWEDYSLKRLPLLDACGAHIGPTPESSTPVYHYHVQDQAPFTVGCHGPSQSGGLVSVAVCRSLYSDCDNDGGSGTTISTKTGNVQYDRFCPCFDATGSNMGTNIQELPALRSSAIYYTADGSSTSMPSSGPSPPPSTTAAGGSADCSGEGVTWGPGIGPPPDGCGGTGPSPPPSGNTGGSCQNPSCANPPCAAPLLGDVGCTTVAGNEIYAHEQLAAGDTISSGAHIFGPFEAGFSSQQDNIIATWGCSTPSVTWIQDMECKTSFFWPLCSM